MAVAESLKYTCWTLWIVGIIKKSHIQVLTGLLKGEYLTDMLEGTDKGIKNNVNQDSECSVLFLCLQFI